MAKFNFDEAGINQELIDMVLGLASTDDYAPRILSAAAVPLENELKTQCNKHRRTGTMADSIQPTKPKKSKDGWYVAVRPTGSSTKYYDRTGKLRDRKTPIRNMNLLAYIEHGTSKQAKEPVIATAVANSKDSCEHEIQRMYNQIVDEKG